MDIPNNLFTSAELFGACDEDSLLDDPLHLGTYDVQAFESLLDIPWEQGSPIQPVEMFDGYLETYTPEPHCTQISGYFDQTATTTSPDPSLPLVQSSHSTAQENLSEDIADVPPLSSRLFTNIRTVTYENPLQNIAPAPYPRGYATGSISPRGLHQPASSHEIPLLNSDAGLPFPSTSSNSAPTKACPHASCPKSFKRQSDLRKHLKYHVRPTKCGRCDYTTGYPRDLRRHMEAWHTETVFKCHTTCPVDSCHKEFTRPDNMRRHLKNKHAVDLSE